MRIFAANVVKKYVVHNAALAIALIMRCSDEEAGNMVVISDFAIVRDSWIEGAVLTAADAAHECIFMVCLLLTGQWSHSAVYFEVFDDVSLLPDELVEEFVY